MEGKEEVYEYPNFGKILLRKVKRKVRKILKEVKRGEAALFIEGIVVDFRNINDLFSQRRVNFKFKLFTLDRNGETKVMFLKSEAIEMEPETWERFVSFLQMNFLKGPKRFIPLPPVTFVELKEYLLRNLNFYNFPYRVAL